MDTAAAVEKTQLSAPAEQTPANPPAPAVDGTSTLASANTSEERGFFGTIYDGIASVFSWIKDKFVAAYNWICCSSSSDTDSIDQVNDDLSADMGNTQKIEALKQDQTAFKELATSFNADTWTATFNGLTKEQQDRIVREDLFAWANVKLQEPTTADKLSFVESALKVQQDVDDALRFVRDLNDDIVDGTTYEAAKIVPKYLNRIAERIGKEIEELETPKLPIPVVVE